VSVIELPRRRDAPRTFVETPPDLARRVKRALSGLGNLPDELELPGREELADALIAIADELEGDADLEAEEDLDGEDENLPLLAFAGLTRR
jgi:hypothetical protein